MGLLHDVGKLIEKRYFPEDFNEIITVGQEQHLSWMETEKALFQINHATIGKVVFRNWNFPASVVDAVHFHHNPESSSKYPQLAALVHIADYISYELGYGTPRMLSAARSAAPGHDSGRLDRGPDPRCWKAPSARNWKVPWRF